jgi:hypothetical protein
MPLRVATFPCCRAHDLFAPAEEYAQAIQRGMADEVYWLNWITESRSEGSVTIRVARRGDVLSGLSPINLRQAAPKPRRSVEPGLGANRGCGGPLKILAAGRAGGGWTSPRRRQVVFRRPAPSRLPEGLARRGIARSWTTVAQRSSPIR